ncbi:SusC/RagA family TonB-linked outer membrane protein [Portibacter lacus]|uniref:SusC/RagA family TonB-linked outer membrane protein n=1 Tax=Portibacter lacus TaxID=1099794 RepID=A0AA37WDJ2_9BACT|nr:SusC/RagA family TonB-linked outer membrane protein [Portibacter lacus]GLR16948.1 SusC/RagA family TonB-linked outer membrane protein [Portibacter lacus]
MNQKITKKHECALPFKYKLLHLKGIFIFLLFANFINGQTTITGLVTDSESIPLIGVSVINDADGNGTITDIDGTYSIVVAEGATTLTFSYVGYKPFTAEIGNATVINHTMEVDAIGLEEVVVVGYGTVKKKDLTGAVSQIDAEQLEKESTANISDMLRGALPGLNVGFGMGPKGISSAESFQVRGATNLRGAAANAPLIVVDGMIYSGDLANINPNDIAKFDILKDASSAAIYGSRASNGVILITTKKGKTGKPTINLTSSVGFVALSGQEIDPLTADEFIDWRIAGFESAQRNQVNNPGYYNDPRSLSGVSVDDWKTYDGSSANDDLVGIWLNRLGFSVVEIANYKNGATEDWKSRSYQSGIRNDHNLSVSGGSDNVRYYMSMGYTNNEGHVYNSSWEALRSRLNLEADITNFLSVGANIQFAAKDESPISASTNLTMNTPYASFYEEDGITIRGAPTGNTSSSRHPYLGLEYTDRYYNRNALNAKVFGDIKLPFGISFTSEFIPGIVWDRRYEHRSSKEPFVNDGGRVLRNNYNSYEWQMNNILRWDKTFGIHRFNVTMLQNAEKFQRWQDEVVRSQILPSDVLGYHDIGSATNNVNIWSDDVYETGTALMARLNYTLNEKYMFTGSVRRDGYSAFGQQNPTADFGSLALGWIISEENFFNSNLIDFLKLRLSYGTNGNRSIGRYAALSDLATGNYVQVINGTPTYVSQLYSTRLANSNLKWEKTAAYNGGLDFAIANGRISGNVEAYYMQTTDLLVSRSLPDVTGYNNVTANLGQVDNRGFEVSLNTVNIDKPNFDWNTSFSVAFNRNEIVHLYGDFEDVVDDNGNVIGQKESDDVANGWFIGHAIDEIWNYEVLGIWQEEDREEAAEYSRSPGDFKINDTNGDGVYTNEDKIFQGYADPLYRVSFRNDFSYKNWDLSVKLYSYLGHKAANNHRKNDDVFYDRASGYQVPYWTPENPLTEWARVESFSSGFSVYENNSFVRVDNVALSYNVPQDLIAKLALERLNVSFVMQNPTVWAPSWTWMDPEQKGYTPSFYTFKINASF